MLCNMPRCMDGQEYGCGHARLVPPSRILILNCNRRVARHDHFRTRMPELGSFGRPVPTVLVALRLSEATSALRYDEQRLWPIAKRQLLWARLHGRDGATAVKP
jgi:hypothetical protein